MYMKRIEYAALNYYPTMVSSECICIGVLFHNLDDGEIKFSHIHNYKRFQTFDDEISLKYIRNFLTNLESDILYEYDVTNFNLSNYTEEFVNNYRFQAVKRVEVEENEDYITQLSKVYLKFDFQKKNRLSAAEELKWIKTILASKDIECTDGETKGEYDDSLRFDFKVKDCYVKYFSFENNNLSRNISIARQWAFAAQEIPNKVIFLFDSNTKDKKSLEIILKILSKNAVVLKKEEVDSYFAA